VSDRDDESVLSLLRIGREAEQTTAEMAYLFDPGPDEVAQVEHGDHTPLAGKAASPCYRYRVRTRAEGNVSRPGFLEH